MIAKKGLSPTVKVARIYCQAEGDFHARYGRTWLATFLRNPLTGTWTEMPHESGKVRRQWVEGANFGNDTVAGRRPTALTHLRGDEPAPFHEQHLVEAALADGTRPHSRGQSEARPEDLAGRAKIDIRRCRCGEPALRVRAEKVWPILNAVFEEGGNAREVELSVRTLRKAVRLGNGA